MREGADFTIVTYGVNINTAIEAAETLSHEGISVEIIKLGQINPIDIEIISGSTAKTGRLMVLEECSGRGSVGEYIAASLVRGSSVQGSGKASPKRGRANSKFSGASGNDNKDYAGNTPKMVILMNTGDTFASCGEIGELRECCGIDSKSVCEAVRENM